jgi:hypothetical protein
MSAADTPTSAGFFIAERHVMKDPKGRAVIDGRSIANAR